MRRGEEVRMILSPLDLDRGMRVRAMNADSVYFWQDFERVTLTKINMPLHGNR